MIFSVAQFFTLIDMFHPPPQSSVVSASSLSEKRLDEFTRSFAATRLLEECITSCETLAENLGSDPGTMELQGCLSECIAACTGYLAATIRESRHTFRYAQLCGEVCGETARDCGERTDLASKFCEVLCHACANFVREESAAALAN